MPAGEEPKQASHRQASGSQGAADEESTQAVGDDSILSELETRIRDLETAEEQRFGTFTRVDWIVCTIGSILLPYLLIIWFWP